MTNGLLVLKVSVPSAFELLGGDREIRISLSRQLSEWEQAAIVEQFESIEVLYEDLLSYVTADVNPRDESFEEVIQFLNHGLGQAAARLQEEWEREHARVIEDLRPVASRQGFELAE